MTKINSWGNLAGKIKFFLYNTSNLGFFPKWKEFEFLNIMKRINFLHQIT